MCELMSHRQLVGSLAVQTLSGPDTKIPITSLGIEKESISLAIYKCNHVSRHPSYFTDPILGPPIMHNWRGICMYIYIYIDISYAVSHDNSRNSLGRQLAKPSTRARQKNKDNNNANNDSLKTPSPKHTISQTMCSVPGPKLLQRLARLVSPM